MIVKEHVVLAPLTTLKIGGAALYYIEAESEKDVEEAIVFAREKNLSLLIMGEGSNVLVPDAGIKGVVLKIVIRDIVALDQGDNLLIRAGAGALWEDVVDEVGGRGVFGIENLAGIPGSLGGAVVQNIGAYGAELSSVFEYAECINSTSGLRKRIGLSEADFGYRTSFFKKNPDYIITTVALRLSKTAAANLEYADVARAQAGGATLSTPVEIARTVREIRNAKFPQSKGEGTAGSFFKNPIVSHDTCINVEKRFPGLPSFPDGSGGVKISLAWLLDHALSLKGYTKGRVRLFEKQPLVIVAQRGSSANEVDAFANEIAKKVFTATNIRIEREVETFGAQKSI